MVKDIDETLYSLGPPGSERRFFLASNKIELYIKFHTIQQADTTFFTIPRTVFHTHNSGFAAPCQAILRYTYQYYWLYQELISNG